MSFQVGQNVRVYDTNNQISQIATVSFVHEENCLYDVLYQNLEEECSVTVSRIKDLEEFEFNVDQIISAEVSKNNGNRLFELKDYHAAMKFYKQALATLSHRQGDNMPTLAIGQTVLVIGDASTIDFFVGMVSDETDGLFDVIVDGDELMGVRRDHLVAVAVDNADMATQRSAYMNLARCSLKLHQTGWAVRYVSYALGITRALAERSSTNSQINKLLSDCHFFRAKALLQANRPGLALKDARELKGFDSAKGEALEAEISQFRAKQQKANRKLARDVAKWVDSALSGVGGSGVVEAEADLRIADDDEVEASGNAEQMTITAPTNTSLQVVGTVGRHDPTSHNKLLLITAAILLLITLAVAWIRKHVV